MDKNEIPDLHSHRCNRSHGEPDGRINPMVHFVGEWAHADVDQVLSSIHKIEPLLMPNTQVIPEAKPWTMICHDSFDPIVYLASRIGLPGVFRAHTAADLISVINDCVTELN